MFGFTTTAIGVTLGVVIRSLIETDAKTRKLERKIERLEGDKRREEEDKFDKQDSAMYDLRAQVEDLKNELFKQRVALTDKSNFATTEED